MIETIATTVAIASRPGRLGTRAGRPALGPAPTPSDGRASVAQLGAAGAVRALAAPRRLDASGAVVRADAASGADARMRRETDANGRGGVEGWKAQWWDAATDARRSRGGDRRRNKDERGIDDSGRGKDGKRGIDDSGLGRRRRRRRRGILFLVERRRGVRARVRRARHRGGVGVGRGRSGASVGPRPAGVFLSLVFSRVRARFSRRRTRGRARLRGEWSARWGHLATKPDVRVLAVPRPPHPRGRGAAENRRRGGGNNRAVRRRRRVPARRDRD